MYILCKFLSFQAKAGERTVNKAAEPVGRYRVNGRSNQGEYSRSFNQ